jgi:hypothetical protein
VHPTPKRYFLACLVAAAIFSQAWPAFAAAPRPLYDKTIHVSWSVAVDQVAPDGRRRNVPVAVKHTVYVSTAGRLFERASRATRKGEKQTENAPGATRNRGGEATNLHFEGSRLVGTTVFAQGARRFVVSFDANYSTCSVAVLFGRDAKGLKRKGVDGRMYTIESMKASSEACSISAGNSFAN